MNIKTKLTGVKDALRVFLVVRRNRQGLSVRGLNIPIPYYLSVYINNGTFTEKEVIFMCIYASRIDKPLIDILTFWYYSKFKYGIKIRNIRMLMDKSLMYFNCLNVDALKECSLL